ncbi:MAG: hypothetical protein M1816_002622 [Peltula sp. TS41687]|nr:MAG: hypothetical protein M1816_002622 [Peltula sp. TS41687]
MAGNNKLHSPGQPLPPHTVRIKRKKDEEPVDSLYIQLEPEQKRRRFSDFVFRRVWADGEPGVVRAGIPSKPSWEKQPGQNISGLNAKRTGDSSAPQSSPVQLDSIPVDEPTSTLPLNTDGVALLPDRHGAARPDAGRRQLSIREAFTSAAMPHVRRFHLAKSAMSLPHGVVGGVRKLKRTEKTSAALLFEEIKSRAKGCPATKGDGDNTLVEQIHEVGLSPRKRPKTKRGEDPWRAQGTKGAAARSTTSQEKDPLAKEPVDKGPTEFSELPSWAQDLLSVQLRSVALDGGARPQTPLKVKPTAPSLRYRERHPDSSDEMVDEPRHESGGVPEDETEYVYDTFVREPRQHMLNDENFGLLVVDVETQSAWEALEDADDSDDGEIDEEEDENSENYYANDYPEEEEGDPSSDNQEEDENEDEYEDEDSDIERTSLGRHQLRG